MVKKIALSVLIAGLVGSQAFASFDKLTKMVNVHNATTLGAVAGTTFAFNKLVNGSGPMYAFGTYNIQCDDSVGNKVAVSKVGYVSVLGFGVQAETPAKGETVSRVLNTKVSVEGVTVGRTLAAAVAYGALKYGLPFVHQAVAKALPKK